VGVRGDLLHRRLPRPDQPARSRADARADARDGRRPAGARAGSGALHTVRAEPSAYKEKKANQPDDVNHGLLTYPVLQAADIVIYKASLVPVGKDQAAHLELSREIVRAFNSRYGPTFPEPMAVHTEAPIVLGTDGVRKMSKSIGNTIDIFAPEDVLRKQIMGMVTDTKRILRTDPGRPEVCNVCQLHRSFGDDYEAIWEGERTARTGCVDTKRLLFERVLAHYAEPRERYAELMADPARIDRILDEGAERVRPIAAATMAEVREKMGLR
jgi:tryptophanyl-tRNA synthetase